MTAQPISIAPTTPYTRHTGSCHTGSCDSSCTGMPCESIGRDPGADEAEQQSYGSNALGSRRADRRVRRSAVGLLRLWMALTGLGLLSGCLSPAQRMAFTDPPYLSPYADPLTAESPDSSASDAVTPYSTSKPTAPATQQPALADEPGRRPDAPQLQRETQKPSPTVAPQDSVANPPDAPSARPPEGQPFVLPRIPPPPSVTLTLTAPAQQRVERQFVCEVTVVNTGQQTLDDLTVECALDDGLVLPGRTDRRVQSGLKPLGPGESQELRITLVARTPGKLCCVFIVRSGQEVAAQREHCLQALQGGGSNLSVEISGPGTRTIGSRAEFNIKLANQSQTPIENVMLDITYSDCLSPHRASRGVQQHTGRLLWRIGKLDAGQVGVFQAEFNCERISDQCPLSIVAEADGTEGIREEAILKIMPVPGNLDVQLADDRDPVSVGGEATLEARVQNLGLQVVNTVVVKVSVPANCRVITANVIQEGQDQGLRFTLEGQTVVFEKVPVLPPNTVLSFRVRVKTLRAGDTSFVVQTEHEQRDDPLVLHETLTVTP